MKIVKVGLFVFLLYGIFIPNVFAHPGRTDANGCHVCKTNCEQYGLSYGEYHCHNGSSPSGGGSSSSSGSGSSSGSSGNTTIAPAPVPKSSDNTLKNIIINEKVFTNLTNITYNTKAEVVTIKATPNDSKAKVQIGNTNLNIGNNDIVITVTAEDGSVKTYQVQVIRRKLSNDNTLKSITVDNQEFKVEDNLEYVTKQEKVDIEAIPNDLNALVKISNVNLELGENKITITVTAEDKSIKTYNLKVTREELSNDNTLKSITIDDDNLDIDKELEYKTKKDKVKIEVVPNNSFATYEIENPDLELGENEIIITVTAEDKSIKTYNIKVIREELSSNTDMTLYVDGKEITFVNNEARVKVTSNSLNYEYKVDDNSKVEVLNADLKEGENEVKFIVTAEDGTIKTYILKVNKESNNSNSFLIYPLLVVGIGGALGIGSFMQYKRKNK